MYIISFKYPSNPNNQRLLISSFTYNDAGAQPEFQTRHLDLRNYAKHFSLPKITRQTSLAE